MYFQNSAKMLVMNLAGLFFYHKFQFEITFSVLRTGQKLSGSKEREIKRETEAQRKRREKQSSPSRTKILTDSEGFLLSFYFFLRQYPCSPSWPGTSM